MPCSKIFHQPRLCGHLIRIGRSGRDNALAADIEANFFRSLGREGSPAVQFPRLEHGTVEHRGLAKNKVFVPTALD